MDSIYSEDVRKYYSANILSVNRFAFFPMKNRKNITQMFMVE